MESLSIEELTCTLEAVIEAQRRADKLLAMTDPISGSRLRRRREVLEGVRIRLTSALSVRQAELLSDLQRNGKIGGRCPKCTLWMVSGKEHECPTK